MKPWRPPDWENPHDTVDNPWSSLVKAKHNTFETGADAMLKARDKWILEWLEEHSSPIEDGHILPQLFTRTDKLIKEKDWQQLKKELKEK